MSTGNDATELANEAIETGRMVEVAVAAHDRLEIVRVDREAAHVLDHPVGTDPAVVQEAMFAVALADADEERGPCSASSGSGTIPCTIVPACSNDPRVLGAFGGRAPGRA